MTDYFFFDPLGNLIGRWRLKQYTSAENNDTIWRWSAEEKFYYLGSRLLKAVDRLGSTASHLPYGEERTVTANDRVKFATYWRDGNTGLDYAWHRQYAATYGRFMSPDPYQASGGPADPGSWNRYAYVGGDPVNRIDPMGFLDFRQLLERYIYSPFRSSELLSQRCRVVVVGTAFLGSRLRWRPHRISNIG